MPKSNFFLARFKSIWFVIHRSMSMPTRVSQSILPLMLCSQISVMIACEAEESVTPISLNQVIDSTSDDVRLTLGISGGQLVYSLAEGYGNLLLSSIAEATAQSNSANLQVSGTLRQSGQQLLYEPQPMDRLQLIFTNGQNISFTVRMIDGNFMSLDDLLMSDYMIDFNVSQEGLADLDIQTTQQNGVTQEQALGTFIHNGISLSVDLQAMGTSEFEVEPNYVSHTAEANLRGSLTTNDFTLNLNEQYYYKFAQFDRGVEEIRHNNQSEFNIGTRRFTVTADIRRVFINTRPDSLDEWFATGALTQNGTQIGTLTQTQDTFAIKTLLQMNDGRTITIFDDSLM